MRRTQSEEIPNYYWEQQTQSLFLGLGFNTCSHVVAGYSMTGSSGSSNKGLWKTWMRFKPWIKCSSLTLNYLQPFHDSIYLVKISSFGNRLTLLLYTYLPIYLCSSRIYFSKPTRNTWLLEKGLVKKNRIPLTQGVVTGFHLVNSIKALVCI